MVSSADEGILNCCYEFNSSVLHLSNELVPMGSLSQGWFPNCFLSNHTPSSQHTFLPFLTSLTSIVTHVSLFLSCLTTTQFLGVMSGGDIHLDLLILSTMALTQSKCAAVS